MDWGLAFNWLSPKGNSSSLGKFIIKWEINIVRRPSGGGCLHSGGITYALTFKKTYYKVLSYEMVNNWLIKSFRELGLNLQMVIYENHIKTNCFGTS